MRATTGREKRYEVLRQMMVGARLRAGVRQEDLAKALGRHQSFVSKYEAGRQRLEATEFLHIAAVLDLDVAEVARKLGIRRGGIRRGTARLEGEERRRNSR